MGLIYRDETDFFKFSLSKITQIKEMSKRNIFLCMLLVNFLFLCFYFVFYSSEPHPHIPLRFHVSVNNQSTSQKPWPILPSYLPWTPPQKNLPRGSCEGYFGNGFTRRVDFLKPKNVSKGSWFRCFYSETLQSSICEARNLRMVPDRIVMSNGGEKLEEVVGRKEEEELPEFRDGAFEVAERGGGRVVSRRLVSDEMLNEYIQEGDIDRHTMRDLVASIRLVGNEDFICEEWVEEPTLLVTRFEYANLFHTVTDWYNAYVSSRVTGLPNRPHIVFIDGHCTTRLEETWTALFSGIRYAKNFSRPVCFRHAILSPLGYESGISYGVPRYIDCNGESSHNLWQNPDDKKTARISEFGEMIRSAFGFPVNRHHSEEQPPSSSTNSVHNVLFLRREDYLAHPRYAGKVQSRLINEEEVFNSLHHWVAFGLTGLTNCEINLVNGTFAHMSMKDQVRAIQDASVIIGGHGAGMTHIVSATPNTTIIEIVNVELKRPHYELIAKWKGLEYHVMHLTKSRADPTAMIEKLKEIMRSLGC